MLAEIWSHPFMVRALLAGVLVSLPAALIGTSLVLRKNSMLGDGLSHVAFGAFAIATVLGIAPLWFALPVSIVASFLILKLSKSRHTYGDAAIALVSVSALAIGTLVISVSQGVNIDLSSYLFGSVLAVSWEDVVLCLVVAVAAVVLYLFSHHRIFAITFDADFARAMGVRVGVYDAIFAIICSIVVVLGMRLLGALLISSIIIFPALFAMKLCASFKWTVVVAAVEAVVAFVLGLALSYGFSLPSGSTVVVVHLVLLLMATGIRWLRH